MKKAGLILITCLSFFQSIAQETIASEPKKLQQLYLGMGFGGAFTNAENMASTGANSFIHLTAALPKNNLIRVAILLTSFEDTQPASQQWKKDDHLMNMMPYHVADSYFLAVGKRRPFEKHLQFQAFAGLSYTRYEEPVSVNQQTADFGFFGAYPVLDYEVKTHQKPGVILQAETMFLPLRFAGITLGGYYHFVPKISNGGFTLSLNLGRIRTKEIL